MNNLKPIKALVFSSLLICTIFYTFGCQTTSTPTTKVKETDSETAKKETSDSPAKEKSEATGNSKDPEGSENIIEVREPESYEGKITLRIFGLGEKESVELPASLEAKFAKKSTNKRMEFNLPNQQKIVYLEVENKKFIIIPGQKQFAEFNEKSTGFQVRNLMTPEQMIKQVKNLRGVEKIGEEKVGDRLAVKYKYSNETKTNTKAGDVKTESFILVDKETGLPLRTEFASKTDSKFQGYNGIKLVTEMKDIKTDVADDIFQVPQDYEKVEEEKIRQQISMIFQAASVFLEQFVKSMTTNQE